MSFPSPAVLGLVLAGNGGLAFLLATEHGKLAAAYALVPLLLLALGALVASSRVVLVFVAFALDISGESLLRYPLPLPGALRITVPDLLILAALGSWTYARAVALPHDRPRPPRTPLVGWPLVIFGVFLIAAIVRGHEEYGAPIVGQPLRFLMYAAIAWAVTDVGAKKVLDGIVVVFYLGCVWEAVQAIFYLGTGTPLVDNPTPLSTGGVRLVSLTGALYLIGGLVLALLKLEFETRARLRALHLGVAALALFGIIVSYGRGIYLATAMILVVLLAARGSMRSGLIQTLPLFAPVAVLVALALPAVAPNLVPTFVERVGANHLNDPSVHARTEYYAALLRQAKENPLVGVGFGRETDVTVEYFTRFHISQDAHNSYLFLLAGGGVVTLGSFAFLIGVFLWDSLARLRTAVAQEETILIVWAVATWFAFAFNTLFEPQLTQPASLLSFWTLMVLPAVVARRSAPR